MPRQLISLVTALLFLLQSTLVLAVPHPHSITPKSEDYTLPAASLIAAFANTVSSEVSSGFLHDLNNQGLDGQIANKIGHAILGCAAQSVQKGDCQSGAIGAVAGEIIAEELREGILEDESLKGLTGEAYADRLDELTKQAVAHAKLISASVALVGGLDVSSAAQAAENAARNNALFLIPVAALLLEVTDKAITAKEAYDLVQAVDAGDDQRAQELATGLGIGLATNAIPGNKIIQRIAGWLKNKRTQVAEVTKGAGGALTRTINLNGKQVHLVGGGDPVVGRTLRNGLTEIKTSISGSGNDAASLFRNLVGDSAKPLANGKGFRSVLDDGREVIFRPASSGRSGGIPKIEIRDPNYGISEKINFTG